MITWQHTTRLRLAPLWLVRPVFRLVWLDRKVNTGLSATISLN